MTTQTTATSARRRAAVAAPPPRRAARAGSPAGALKLTFAFTAAFAAFVLLPQIRANSTLAASFAGAAAVLLAWLAALWIGRRSADRPLRVELALRPQHYLQAIAHTAIFVYWGIYWPPLQDAAALVAAQIVFAYAFDSLLAWSRRDTFTLGFGPFPIIYSTNLFLRFRDDWFYLQFAMIAVGFLAKELIRWEKDGRRTHIFNPSSFPLALFSIGLIVTGTTELTWGEDIASLLILPPQIYLFIFLVALPGQYLFRVTTMTMPAVATTYLFSAVYLKATGTYFFFDANVPIAVFLGMHLLFTDPSTAPRTELGRIIFGVIYGLTVVGLYALLGWLGAPTFYDKLLQVPLMNLMVRRIDRVAGSRALRWLDPARLGAGLAPQKRSLAYVAMWIAVFGAMTAARGIGDHHPGHTVPFWQRACDAGRASACTNLAQIISAPCRNESAWACNELGILVAEGRVKAAPAGDLFRRACNLGLEAGCENAQRLPAGGRGLQHDEPRLQDYVHLLQEGKGPIRDASPLNIFTRACDQGWAAGCGSLAGFHFRGLDTPRDPARAVALLDGACEAGHGRSCSNLGLMYQRGDAVARDEGKAKEYLQQACARGFAPACGVLERQAGSPAPR